MSVSLRDRASAREPNPSLKIVVFFARQEEDAAYQQEYTSVCACLPCCRCTVAVHPPSCERRSGEQLDSNDCQSFTGINPYGPQVGPRGSSLDCSIFEILPVEAIF